MNRLKRILLRLFRAKPLLIQDKIILVEQSGLLDESWYLTHYPDVGAAQMPAAFHFAVHGLAEGRVATQSHLALWTRPTNKTLIASLTRNLRKNDPIIMPYVAWLLGRWYASQSKWPEVYKVMSVLIRKQGVFKIPSAQFLLWVDALRHIGKFKKAQGLLLKRLANEPNNYDLVLSLANVVRSLDLSPHKHESSFVLKWLERVNEIYLAEGVCEIQLGESTLVISIDDLICQPACVKACSKQQDKMPLVSIVVPAFNAAGTITTVIDSLLQQSWKHIEVVVVDDASTDNTVKIISALAQQDSRVRLLKMPTNSGAYACRNLGAHEAKGDFITVQDADDWSHCQKIEKQVNALIMNPQSMASVSSWVRVSEVMEFGSWQTPSGWTGWIHRNTSSLMIRKTVLDDIGYWDNVVCNADTEYLDRLSLFYGENAVLEVAKNIPLSFGRFHGKSLTQLGETNIFTIFEGLRKDYTDSYSTWHASIENKKDLYLPLNPAKRPFDVPDGMLKK